MTQSAMTQTVTERWATVLCDHLPRLLAEHEALRPWSARTAALLHGSTTRGLDDAWSDLDVWLLLPDEALQALAQPGSVQFFEFCLLDKPGHFTMASMAEMHRRVARCDFPLIAELRTAQVLCDETGEARPLLELAGHPMPESVRHAWARYHYVEMRSEHRAADNPIERGDALALLQATVAALRHAMQAAMILDRQPYPYVKWLAQAARQTPTGRQVTERAEELLGLLAAGALQLPGPEKQHPVSLKLREIRAALIEAMRHGGLDEPWLDKWYLYLPQTRCAAADARWTDET